MLGQDEPHLENVTYAPIATMGFVVGYFFIQLLCTMLWRDHDTGLKYAEEYTVTTQHDP